MGCRQSKKEEAAAAEAGDQNAEGEKAQEESGDSPRLIAVFGATGDEGGSVAESLIKDPKYTVRAVTSDAESEKAKLLAEQGAEVVAADLNDADSIKAAVEGAYGVFLVTEYWPDMDMEKEMTQGKNVVDAAKEAGVEHLVFSGLENVKEALGKSCPHYDGKAQVVDYLKEQEVPHTVVFAAYHMENLLSQSKPQKNEEGDYVLGIPLGDIQLDMIPIVEIGECIRGVFDEPDEYKGKQIGLASDTLKVDEYAAIMTKALDKNVVASTMTPEGMAELDLPGAKELSVMFEFIQSGGQARDSELTRKLHADISTFEQWVDTNKDKLVEVLEE